MQETYADSPALKVERDGVALPNGETRLPPLRQPNVGDYGVIGDCRSAALISSGGSIDWLCWPNFNSAPVFSRLLDSAAGGVWSVTPRTLIATSRRYVGSTNVLETTFETESGTVTLTDFMPAADEAYLSKHFNSERQITRIIQCISGRANLDVLYVPRGDFNAKHLRLVVKGGLGIVAELSCGTLYLQGPLDWRINYGQARAKLVLNANETCVLMLTFASEAPAVLPPLSDWDEERQRTLQWWGTWSAQFSYTGPHKEAVQRSVLALKLLQFAPTGAFVAAATTSIPERVGGQLNWDYRYCWLRDASFNVQALCGTGYGAEAEAFLEWMLHATRLTQPKLMTAYDLFGNHVPKERTVEGFAGFRGSVPVRTGNLAGEQHQLDTYGEVICGAAQIIKSNGFADRETQHVLTRFGEFVAKHWQDPDAGIWESREEPVVHTHSRLLCWVAMDELLKMHESGLIERLPRERFEHTRTAIRNDLERLAWRDKEGTYTAEPGKSKLDAALLLFALHDFAEPGSERLQKTYQKVVEVLRTGDKLLLRNLPEKPEAIESAFGICGFWEAEFLAMGGGSLEAAEAHFAHLLSFSNDLGLYAEEIDPDTGEAVGNFPQTFTHVGLINAALALEKRRHPDQESSTCTV